MIPAMNKQVIENRELNSKCKQMQDIERAMNVEKELVTELDRVKEIMRQKDIEG